MDLCGNNGEFEKFKKLMAQLEDTDCILSQSTGAVECNNCIVA